MANRASQLHAFYLTSGSYDPDKWASLVREFASHSFLRQAALVYARRLPRRTHHQPLLPVLLKAAAAATRVESSLGRSLHAEAVKSASSRDLLVGTTLVSMYCKAGALPDASRVFDELPERNVVSCNALLSGYAATGDMSQALALFDGMPAWTSVTWATLTRGLAERGDMVEARKWF
jgi:pentatricopeptide repeat protein